ncbi:pyrroloquinoline quinone biosynthesis protein PqqB [Thiocapsa rosea]|uniref:Coenzyme PQQ synthesis protein B n=1 Tax=Thiocapsa rosea TaxID=69360 RepID=A0A495VCN2_9GAMM|nr:pyrroloquinoline quinone biosynthesis protein PqqB [Thiocapsa rosea]RKT47099.1 pyrroloquinoline quinone biosynthesis protein B [Thiocapsa rosea]
MKIRVLGSGAGGGFPQWNCNCRNCAGVRSGRIAAHARTQSSIAVSANGHDWILLNASPDIRSQLESFPALQPARRVRDTAIRAILLVDAQIDHTTGLLMLREHTAPWDVYCTEAVYEDLTTGFPVFTVLSHFRGVIWHEIVPHGGDFVIPGSEGLVFGAVPLKSEAPPFSPHRHNTVPGDNIGVRIRDSATGGRLFYAPGLGSIDPQILREMEAADCLLIDGTLWTDDEMIRGGIGDKRGLDMGHLAQASSGGLIEHLSRLDCTRKILIHINNTNPILDETSPERRTLEQAGIEVAYDGMDIEL